MTSNKGFKANPEISPFRFVTQARATMMTPSTASVAARTVGKNPAPMRVVVPNGYPRATARMPRPNAVNINPDQKSF